MFKCAFVTLVNFTYLLTYLRSCIVCGRYVIYFAVRQKNQIKKNKSKNKTETRNKTIENRSLNKRKSPFTP